MNQTEQPQSKLNRERSFLLAIFIVIVGYIFLAAPDTGATCTANLRANTTMTAEEIARVCP